MVLPYTTRVITVALLAVLAQLSHASWNVYSTFFDGESSSHLHPSSPKSYDVGEDACISLPRPARYVQFSKNWLNSQHIAEGPYCLHYYFHPCTKDDMKGDDMWQYQNVHITGKTLFHNKYNYEVGFPNQTAAFKWISGNCSNPSKTIDGNNVTEAYVTKGKLNISFRRSVRPIPTQLGSVSILEPEE
ncbi:hypothetical protein BDU57DRAFT_511490 [Ampelomyces quisqualis]|uniref:AA1-like domain-containing protein n=1 Tax=Ampelomyces quisqualis TaxID=50730 RepID=A0A6A5QTJ7_AMPQU|nr:hypothetical protein BDU57DRAFT_511490 [Ampelomyces quisqualis]